MSPAISSTNLTFPNTLKGVAVIPMILVRSPSSLRKLFLIVDEIVDLVHYCQVGVFKKQFFISDACFPSSVCKEAKSTNPSFSFADFLELLQSLS